MQEELIKLETAKLAKGKGFDWETLRYYALENISHFWGMGNHNNINSPYSDSQCSAPSQSLLHKWLRDTHNIYISIYPIESWWEGDIRDCDSTENVHFSFRNSVMDETRYSTYEEALETGLQEALKLIK